MNNFYVIPLIGGILCISAIFSYLDFLMYSIFVWLIFAIPGIIDLISGIIMLSLAFKIQKGMTTYINEKKKLMTLTWLAIIGSSGLGIFLVIVGGSFSYFFVGLVPVGFAGGVVTFLGILFYRRVNERNFITNPPLIQEKDVYRTRLVEDPKFYPDTEICTNCGTNLEGGNYKFCPNCGNELTPE